MCESWKADIPSLSKGLALILLLLNIFVPPLGTFLLACVGDRFRPTQILVAVLQMLLVGVLVGWIWAVWWGIIIMERSV